MTTQPPANLDTLTDTVGSRIEITAGGIKYIGALAGATEMQDGTIRLVVQDIRHDPTGTGMHIQWLKKNVDADTIKHRPIHAIKELRTHYRPTPTLKEAKDAVDALRVTLPPPSTGSPGVRAHDAVVPAAGVEL